MGSNEGRGAGEETGVATSATSGRCGAVFSMIGVGVSWANFPKFGRLGCLRHPQQEDEGTVRAFIECLRMELANVEIATLKALGHQALGEEGDVATEENGGNATIEGLVRMVRVGDSMLFSGHQASGI